MHMNVLSLIRPSMAGPMTASTTYRLQPQQQLNQAVNAQPSKLAVQPKSSKGLEIPLIDLADLKLSHHHASQAEQTLAAACKEWGFFQVINHGVSSELVQQFCTQILHFFELPLELKQQASGRGSLYGYRFREDAGPLEIYQVPGSDDILIAAHSKKLFPHSSEEFCAIYKEYDAAMRKLALEILDLVIEGLGVDTKHFDVHKRDAQGVLRANYYHQSRVPEQVLGLKPHVDGNLFTILHQDDVGGLEVLNQGRWVPTSPQKDAFCINVADILQALTNGQFKSVLHRAVVPTSKARLSVGYFFTPSPSVTLVPAPELVDSAHPQLYKPFTWSEFTDASRKHGAYPSALPHFELQQRASSE